MSEWMSEWHGTDRLMAALSVPSFAPPRGRHARPVRPHLRLVGEPVGEPLGELAREAEGSADVPRVLALVRAGGRPRLRTSAAVRRRRLLFAVAALIVVGLAFPVGGTVRPTVGGPSLSGAIGKVYTVQPGDTLWSIAVRVDPAADPRPLVSRMAAETGSDTVYPGERLTIP